MFAAASSGRANDSVFVAHGAVETSRALADACGGAVKLIERAEALARTNASASLAAARALAEHAEVASGGDANISTRAREIELEHGRRVILDAYYADTARAARRQRNRSAAKPKKRARDRACRKPKARQGWTRPEMRERNARTCVGCEKIEAKDAMFRIVRCSVTLDNGKQTTTVKYGADADGACGRSAYVCKTRCCVARATKNKSINRALRCSVDKDAYDALAKAAAVIEDDAGVDTSGLTFVRPEGTAARWSAPGVWL